MLHFDILQHIIITYEFYNFLGTASVAKAMTNYVDSLLGDPQKSFMKKYFAMHTGFLGEYPDIASFFFIMTIACNQKYIFSKLNFFYISVMYYVFKTNKKKNIRCNI